jgi:uncharacterized protein YvpB
MNPIYKAIAAAVVCASLSITATAQVNEELADFTTDIEAMRTVMQTERKILIMNEMVFTGEEAEKFWPLYDEYSAAAKKIANLRVKVITDYAANYGTMTDDVAKQLLDDSIKFEEQTMKLKKKYVRKFRSILPEIKVTRYFQLENKLNAIIDFDLASQIPLME